MGPRSCGPARRLRFPFRRGPGRSRSCSVPRSRSRVARRVTASTRSRACASPSRIRAGGLGAAPWSVAVFNPYLGPEEKLAVWASGQASPGRAYVVLRRNDEDVWRILDFMARDELDFGLVLGALRGDGYWLARLEARLVRRRKRCGALLSMGNDRSGGRGRGARDPGSPRRRRTTGSSTRSRRESPRASAVRRPGMCRARPLRAGRSRARGPARVRTGLRRARSAAHLERPGEAPRHTTVEGRGHGFRSPLYERTAESASNLNGGEAPAPLYVGRFQTSETAWLWNPSRDPPCWRQASSCPA